MDNELITALRDELGDVVKYCAMSEKCEYGSILRDIAHEEYQHAKNIYAILEMRGTEIPDMSVQWQAARAALFGNQESNKHPQERITKLS